MNKNCVESLLLKHSAEISELNASTKQMLLLWKIVGAGVLVALGTYLNKVAG